MSRRIIRRPCGGWGSTRDDPVRAAAGSIDGGRRPISGAMGEHETFRLIYLLALLLMLLPLALPLARSGRRSLQMAAIWVLIGGFVLAFYLVAEWLIAG
jgi:hypothetical protein